jgi:hypothetical protein
LDNHFFLEVLEEQQDLMKLTSLLLQEAVGVVVVLEPSPQEAVAVAQVD